jgi:iron complex transport system ATP-binding protein
VADFALTVAEIVALGRAPHHRGLLRDGRRDAAIVADAIDQLGLGPLAQRRIGTLSGGERQRAMVARALAQDPKLLVLDEPTNHLDIRHQLEVLALIRTLGLTIIVSLHDLNLAAQVCDEIVLLNAGRVVAHGPQAMALHPQTLGPVFGVTVTPDRLALSNRDHLTFNLDTQKEPL